ncbi:MAG: Ppx/GppA family phosphatase [Firmicutes bacterium]|nr:Ppx/GppA family phosphatase [Bacillota bacterium]
MKSAIDIGSNSLRLLVTEEVNGTTRVVRQDVEETRMGEGFKEGLLLDASMERTLKVMERWKKELVAEGMEHTLIFATSAVRDAANGKEFAKMVKERTGEELRILSGDEEAWYSYSGAVGGFDFPKEECLLIDIGGGSTELAGYGNGKLHGFSMPMGAVRWMVMDAKREEVKRMMATSVTLNRFDNAKHFIGVGGTITTVGAVLGEVGEYTREAIHGRTLKYRDLMELKHRLSGMTLEERKKVVGMPEKRAEIILYGMEILEILFEILNIPELYISDWGILDGILAES